MSASQENIMGWVDFDTPFVVVQRAADLYQVDDAKGALIASCRFLTDAEHIKEACNAHARLLSLLKLSADRLHCFREQELIADIKVELGKAVVA